MSDYITTYTKKHFTPLSPNAGDIDILDIAHSLSLTVRANGHFPKFHSVAQHCIECALESISRGADPRLSLLCLLHDASEAYIADVTSPVKRHMKEYKAAETVIQNAVYKHLTGALPNEREYAFVKKIDEELLYHEFYYFMGERLSQTEPQLKTEPDFTVVSFEETERKFISLYNTLKQQLNDLKKVKIIALDLDGTLFRNDKTISARTISALKAAADRGIEIVPASGRSFEGIPDKVKSLPGVHYLITTNGADVYTIDGKRVYARSIPCEYAADIARRISEKNVVFGVYIDGRGYMEKNAFYESESRGIPEHVIDYFKKTRTLVDNVEEFILKNNKPAQIITPSFWDIDEELRREIADFVKDYKDLIYVYGGPANIDITHREASKGRGLIEIAKIKGIDPLYTASFGDSENDAEMLKKAGFGFAMGNGDKYAREAADFIALTNEQDAIADVIYRLILCMEV